MGRKQFTDEEKAAFQQRDKELAEAAEAALAEPGAGARATAIALRSPKLASYSLRNQMMLALQAEQAGIELRDVDTGRGWKERGRVPSKGTKAVLRIVYPITLKSSVKAATGGSGEDGESGGTLFRTKAVFEVGQTDALPEHVPDQQAAPDLDPAEVWHARLTRDAERLGFTVVHAELAEAESTDAVVDAEANTITVTAEDPHTPAALAAFAQRLAEIATAAKSDRAGQPATPSRRPVRPDEGTVIDFE